MVGAGLGFGAGGGMAGEEDEGGGAVGVEVLDGIEDGGCILALGGT